MKTRVIEILDLRKAPPITNDNGRFKLGVRLMLNENLSQLMTLTQAEATDLVCALGGCLHTLRLEQRRTSLIGINGGKC